MPNKHSISLLGSGWLGLALLKSFSQQGSIVKVSTTSRSRHSQLSIFTSMPFTIDIENISMEIQSFLQSDILVINIPPKELNYYPKLITKIEQSSISKVLLVSSTSVYSETNILRECAQLDIETLFKANSNFKTTIIRFAGLLGYNRHPGRFFNKKKQIKHPLNPVNMIHRDDCVAIINKIIDQSIWGEIFDCCADSHPTKIEFYSLAAADLQLSPPTFESQSTESQSTTKQAPYKIIDNQKIKTFLNYQFIYPDLLQLFNQNAFSIEDLS